MSRDDAVRWALAMGPDAVAIAKKAIEGLVSGTAPRDVLTQAERDLLAAGVLRSFDAALGFEPEET